MTPKQKENMEAFQELGFSTRHLNYDELVSELIHKYIEVSMACEYTE